VCGSSNRAPAFQVGSPEFETTVPQKKKNKNKNRFIKLSRKNSQELFLSKTLAEMDTKCQCPRIDQTLLH
jgi:hypothetical protein